MPSSNQPHPEEAPTGPRFARPEDRLRGRLEGRTIVLHRTSFAPSADQHSLADDLAVDQGLYRVRRPFQRKAAPDA